MTGRRSTDRRWSTRQDRSAQHYLTGPELAARLLPTVEMTARTLDFPMAAVNILDADFSYTVSHIGLVDDLRTPRGEAFCEVVVRDGQPVIVGDAGADRRFAHYPSVVDGAVGSYLGVPLMGREAVAIGSICVLDSETRPVDASVLARLVAFGGIVEDQLDLIRRLAERRADPEPATAELARAIDEGEITAHYQPIVDLLSDRTVGYEALARWRHPDGELEDPIGFIPLAEDSDLVVDLDLAVLRSALADLRRWQRFDPTIRLSANLSTRHIGLAGGFEAIRDAVIDAGVDPHDIDLELTETTRLINSGPAQDFVTRLRDCGFGVWLDDFGTGWSSMEYLLKLPVSGIKIDRVVSLALGSPVGNAITRSMTALATELGLDIVIEGVATREHAALARRFGCRYAQGYLWSEAVPAARVEHRLAGQTDSTSEPAAAR